MHREAEREHAQHGWAGPSEAFGMGIGITLGDLEEPFTVRALLATPLADARRPGRSRSTFA